MPICGQEGFVLKNGLREVIGKLIKNLSIMEGIVNNLFCISYNCSHADDTRLPLFKELFAKCDFLMLQEHGLHKCQFDWFNNIYDGNHQGRITP